MVIYYYIREVGDPRFHITEVKNGNRGVCGRLFPHGIYETVRMAYSPDEAIYQSDREGDYVCEKCLEHYKRAKPKL